MHKDTKPLYLYVTAMLYSFVMFCSSYAYLRGFYDPFYPTSCVPLERVSQSHAEVFHHSRMYYTNYPLSLILNSILSKILGISCLSIGVVPILPLMNLIFFHVLLPHYVNSQNKRILLISLYSLATVSILNGFHPPFYITLGNAAYFAFLYFLSKRQPNKLATSDFISLCLLALLGTFSYYTSGFAITFTLLLTSALYIIFRLTIRTEVTRFWYLILVITVLYLAFDYVFYRHLKDVFSLASIETLTNILSWRGQEDPLSFKFTYPLAISVTQRLSVYLLLILSIVYALLTLLKILKREITLSQLILVSALISSYILSLYYSFLMRTIYLRYYIHFQTIATSLTFRLQKKLELLLYLSIGFIVVSSLISTIYVASYPNEILSPYTNYVSWNEYQSLCNFLKNSAPTTLFADLKTSFTLPIICNDPNITTHAFKAQFFTYYNETHNKLEISELKTIRNVVFLYASSYGKNGIYMWHWSHYKPFVIHESVFDGIILNSNSVRLYYIR